MTSKEALYKLEKNTNWSSDENIDKDLYNLWGNVACRAIKKDLERLEKLEKVIDILENKIVNILILKYCIAKGGGVETYNLHYKTEDQITQEEYELLKEVFGNGI